MAVAVHTAGTCLTAQPRKDPKDTIPMATGFVALKIRGLPESPCEKNSTVNKANLPPFYNNIKIHLSKF